MIKEDKILALLNRIENSQSFGTSTTDSRLLRYWDSIRLCSEVFWNAFSYKRSG